MSPEGGSTLITSAPKSDRITAAPGPAMKLARSTTFTPEKILSVVISVSLLLSKGDSPIYLSLVRTGIGSDRVDTTYAQSFIFHFESWNLSRLAQSSASETARSLPLPVLTCLLGVRYVVSSTLKLWRALFKKRRGTFLLVFTCGADRKERCLKYQPFRLTCFQTLMNRFERELHGERCVGVDLREDRLGACDQIGTRHYLVNQPDAMGFLGTNDLSGKNKLQGPALPH